MGVIFDTSVLIAIERSSMNIERLVEGREDEPFGISTITVSELLHGVHRADSENRRLKREAYVEKIIETFPIYSLDLSAARIYARIWANLAKRGSASEPTTLLLPQLPFLLAFQLQPLTSEITER